MRRSTFLLSAILVGLSVSIGAFAQDASVGVPTEEFIRAKVVQILEETKDEAFGFDRISQQVILRITSGPEKGKEFTIENGILNDRQDMRMTEGETLIIRTLTLPDDTVKYMPSEKYRLSNILWLCALFLGLVLLLGGMTGISSLIGLAVSVLILIYFIVPQIANGQNPLIVSLIGSFLIACTSLYLAHGFHRRTSVALMSTLVTLCISAALSIAFVSVAKLFGMGTEESMFLQMGQSGGVNLRGLLLGGIIIGCLGVLDDITTAQTAAVDEIRKANPALSHTQLMKAGFSVGKEHIASLINTLALAYAGASLPLLLLFHTGENYPLWVTLNSEFLAEEIVRTLVGSSTLLFAVPISTWFAVKFLRNDGKPSIGHSHCHSHHV